MKVSIAEKKSVNSLTNNTAVRSQMCVVNDEVMQAEYLLQDELEYAGKNEFTNAVFELERLIQSAAAWRESTDALEYDNDGSGLRDVVAKARALQDELRQALFKLRKLQEECVSVAGDEYCEARQTLTDKLKTCFHLARYHLEMSATTRRYNMSRPQVRRLKKIVVHSIGELDTMRNITDIHEHTWIGIRLNKAYSHARYVNTKRFNRNELNLLRTACSNLRLEVIQVHALRSRCRKYPDIPVSMWNFDDENSISTSMWQNGGP